MKKFQKNRFMKRTYSFVSMVLISGLLMSCGNDALKKFQQIEGLRILAIVADQPEVNPASTVNLSLYLADTLGAGRSFTLDVEACIDPGVVYGANPSCANSASRTVIVSAATGAAPGTAPHYIGAIASPVSVSIPAAGVIFANRSIIEQTNGVNYLVSFTITAGTETINGFKRIVVSNRSSLNANPVLTDLSLEGVNYSTAPSPVAAQELNITHTVSAGSKESYTYLKSDLSVATGIENLSVTYLSTSGLFKKSKTDDAELNTFKAADPLPASTFFAVILRDDRGGVEYLGFQK